MTPGCNIPYSHEKPLIDHCVEQQHLAPGCLVTAPVNAAESQARKDKTKRRKQAHELPFPFWGGDGSRSFGFAGSKQGIDASEELSKCFQGCEEILKTGVRLSFREGSFLERKLGGRSFQQKYLDQVFIWMIFTTWVYPFNRLAFENLKVDQFGWGVYMPSSSNSLYMWNHGSSYPDIWKSNWEPGSKYIRELEDEGIRLYSNQRKEKPVILFLVVQQKNGDKIYSFLAPQWFFAIFTPKLREIRSNLTNAHSFSGWNHPTGNW